MRPRRPVLLIVIVITFGMAFAFLPLLSADGSIEFFEKQIRPILSEYCFECHLRERKGGLTFESKQSLLTGGDSGPAVVPGKPKTSLLIRAITGSHNDLKMPPKRSLPDEAIQALQEWVLMGAPWPEARPQRIAPPGTASITDLDRSFWSFQPLSAPPLPEALDLAANGHLIDRLLATKQSSKRLRPLGQADSRTLLRRIAFDLTGLPPSAEEAREFLQNPSERAWIEYVDRLLASPAYGERWGGHWLDLTRYADTAGDASDFPIPEAYRYRNYVIDAFNRDKPYDQFVREQIAGDLLPSHSDDQRWEQTIATGYIATSRRIGVSPQGLKHITIEDTLDNLGKTFLGLTIGCARCHDHKFDPIPTRDYYALYGIFASSIYPHAGAEHQPYRRDFTYRIGDDAADQRLGPFRKKLASWNTREREALRIYREFQIKKIDIPGHTRQSTWKTLLEVREQQRRVAEQFPDLEIAYAIQEHASPQDTHVMKGGAPQKSAQGDLVPRGFLSIFGGPTVPDSEPGSGRLQLAHWLTNESAPLTARVIANRVWLHHFGQGLVRTPSDFGVRGAPPSHPELLDHLARYLIDHSWSIKALHRYILSSAAYRRSSADSPENHRIDPENIDLWRFNRQRLSAEQLRDALLTLSGQLDRRPGQRHPFPHRLTYFYRQHEPFTEDYPTSKRSVYRLRRRLEKDPYLDLFDGPDGNQHLDQRRVTTTPLQALYFLNGSFVDQQARGIAARWVQPSATVKRNLDRLYHVLYGRPARPEEEATLETVIGSDPDAWHTVTKAMITSNEFLFID